MSEIVDKNHYPTCQINAGPRKPDGNPVRWECTCAEQKKVAYEDACTRVRSEIAHQTDGPVTQFVAIGRAIDLARAGHFHVPGIDDPIANVLFEILFGDADDRVLLSGRGS